MIVAVCWQSSRRRGFGDSGDKLFAILFAARNTVEPPIVGREMTMELERDKSWYMERLRSIDKRASDGQGRLSDHIGDSDWLDDSFSAGDLLMILVLLRLEGALLDEFPNLCAYVERGEGRPAYRRDFAAQRAVFERSVSD